jgi:hypothetical protein
MYVGMVWAMSKLFFESDLIRWRIAWNGLVEVRWVVEMADLGYVVADIPSLIHIESENIDVQGLYDEYMVFWGSELVRINDASMGGISVLEYFTRNLTHFKRVFECIFAKKSAMRAAEEKSGKSAKSPTKGMMSMSFKSPSKDTATDDYRAHASDPFKEVRNRSRKMTDEMNIFHISAITPQLISSRPNQITDALLPELMYKIVGHLGRVTNYHLSPSSGVIVMTAMKNLLSPARDGLYYQLAVLELGEQLLRSGDVSGISELKPLVDKFYKPGLPLKKVWC